ncbi:polysaccharide biosynthesis tyrosine autokinase [Amycolatopsis pithecellobii]|uniref:Polysaccharide biosynthesis tyrosine autokinase n=1 Tax=Amycolatopsis pithecellobii TaxID=664692 RepID=A0A6N7YND6_9PSEU|nr:polysaccharide biosynthesis tyrosine autokinase [Amycolatopsis pithecellobii]MTD54507.1 polysaccharide biosynthesis tyrosine autokinase [Amycolatopsis pithecellobii]
MTPHDYPRLARKRWRTILSGLLCGLCGATAFLWRSPPEYAARITIYVPASAQRTDSYAALLRTDRLGRDIAAALGPAMSGADIAGELTFSAGTTLLTVTATDRNPLQAKRIADAAGDVFTQLVTELEPPAPGMPAPAVVLAPAALPTSAVSPDWRVYVPLGALAAGCALALVREFRPRTLKSEEELVRLTETPNLAVLPADPNVPWDPLTVRERPHAPQAHVFRELRANLQFVDVDTARKVIVFAGTVPGSGTTTLLCNLAIVLATAGHRVVLVEADLARPTMAGCLGLDDGFGLTTVLAGRIAVDHALQPWAGSLFDVLAGGLIPPDPAGLLSSGRMRILLDELRCRYDMVLVEAPPLAPGTGAAVLAAAGDGALLVVRHGKTTRSRARSALRELSQAGGRLYGTVLSMVPGSKTGTTERDPQVTAPLAALQRPPVLTVNGRKRDRPNGLPRNGAGHRR